jgi:hypothetical protein
MMQDHVRSTFRMATSGIFALLITALAWGQTPAQGPYVLTTYDIAELASRPGEIVVGTGVLTIIEFEDQVDNVATGRQNLLSIEVQASVILLRGNQNAGRTDLLVRAGGRTVLFTVRIDEQLTSPRRYVVGETRQGSPRLSGTTTSAPVTPAAPVPSTDTAPVPAPAVTDEAPTWLSFHAEVTHAPTGALAISYALANQGEHPVAADASQLRLSYLDPVAGPIRLPYTLSRVSVEGLVNRVAPGGTEFGTIVIKDPPPRGRIALEWSLIQIGPAQSYTVRRSFSEFVREIGR